ncbi:hypothetical protein AACH10_02455 [Ideonella sp. DXS22W]|uniref:Uncharacterized protein n=1 Tax=Pseudaquabacterium inlustre TaxID=2984192 RepID=A0ABU9CB32_9BURK
MALAQLAAGRQRPQLLVVQRQAGVQPVGLAQRGAALLRRAGDEHLLPRLDAGRLRDGGQRGHGQRGLGGPAARR